MSVQIQGVRTWTGQFHNVPVTILLGILAWSDGFYMAKGPPFWYPFLSLPKIFILMSFGLSGKMGKKLCKFFSLFSLINPFFGLIYRKIAYTYPK